MIDWLGSGLGPHDLRIEDDSDARLIVACGASSFTFRKADRRILDGPRRVGAFDDVRRIELRESIDPDRPAFWEVRLVLAERRVSLGLSSDEVAASIVAARIAKTLDRPVVVA